MNKKIVALIIVILISFCFLSIVVADNATNDDNKTTDHGQTINNNKNVDENTTDQNKTNNNKAAGSPNNYILAKGNGNDITFSDGFRGFRLDYSKSPASSGDEFKHASTSKAGNSNTLKLAIIECYKQGATDQIRRIMADFIKTGSSNTPVGEAVAASHQSVSDRAVMKINDHTNIIFDFEYLKSVSGNESDYFAYKVSYITINDGEEDTNQSDEITNVTNTTVIALNITNMTQPTGNETNLTFLNELYDYFLSLLNELYDAWKPIIDTIINFFLMIINTLEEIVHLFENIMTELQTLIDALGQLLEMLGSIWGLLDGILKLLGLILGVLVQILNLIGYIVNLIVWVISAIISLIQQILGLLSGLIELILNLIDQIMSLIQAIINLLRSAGSSMVAVVDNAAVVIITFVIITIGAFIYNRIR